MLGVKEGGPHPFPVATEVLSPQDWQEMYEQSLVRSLLHRKERPAWEGEDQDVEVFQKYKGRATNL